MHVCLVARSSNYDKEYHLVNVEQETETAYIGRPLSNPACPVLTYPKFAWFKKF